MTIQTDLYDELLEDIIVLTNRPDLADETALALRTATRSAHLTDAYPRDCKTSVIQLPLQDFVTQLDLPTLLPRCRGLSRVQVLAADGSPLLFSPEHQLEVIELSDIYNDYGQLRSNVAYIAGDKLNVRTLTPGYGFNIQWFQLPDTRRASYDSWIAQLYPDLLIYWAASVVLDTNGNEDKARKYMQAVQQLHLPYLKSNYLMGELR